MATVLTLATAFEPAVKAAMARGERRGQWVITTDDEMVCRRCLEGRALSALMDDRALPTCLCDPREPALTDA